MHGFCAPSHFDIIYTGKFAKTYNQANDRLTIQGNFMRKYFTLLALVCVALPAAAFDPLGTHKTDAPKGCIDKDAATQELTLDDLIQISLCNNPSLSAGYMGVKASEAGAFAVFAVGPINRSGQYHRGENRTRFLHARRALCRQSRSLLVALWLWRTGSAHQQYTQLCGCHAL